jgi:hypothetical protein
LLALPQEILGTQFTCFTGTKVQILTHAKSTSTDAAHPQEILGTQFTCFTGTKVQILTQKALVESNFIIRGYKAGSVYLLYWYNSTNTDAEGAGRIQLHHSRLQGSNGRNVGQG